MNSLRASGLFLFNSVELLRLAGGGADLEMPDPTSRLDSLGPLADQRRPSAPRMLSGQFPDQILDPAVRNLEQKLGVVADHRRVTRSHCVT